MCKERTAWQELLAEGHRQPVRTTQEGRGDVSALALVSSLSLQSLLWLPIWPNPTRSHKTKVEWSIQVGLPGYKLGGRRVETRQKINQRFEAKDRAVQGCRLSGGANSSFQLVTRHALAHCHLQPFCQTPQGHPSYLKTFAHAVPSAWNSVPSHLLG